jgi:hypothetical protein
MNIHKRMTKISDNGSLTPPGSDGPGQFVLPTTQYVLFKSTCIRIYSSSKTMVTLLKPKKLRTYKARIPTSRYSIY